jgi:catechol 1,2-dioxygenase
VNLSGRITDAASGEPLAGAVLDVWQADHNGSYDLEQWHLAGRITPDADGRYALLTAVPRDYSDHDNDPIGELFSLMGRHNRRAAHIHCKIWIGGECVLTTQLFIEGNAYLGSDYVEGAVSDDLILRLEAGEDDHFTASFDFAVCAPGERSA